MTKGTKPTLREDRKPITKAPAVPSWLGPFAKKEWRRVMPVLVERRILTEADMGSLENYCVASGRVRELEKQITADDGPIDPRIFRMQDQAMKTARQLAAELGLTPVSRSRPTIREDFDDDVSPLDFS